VTDIFFLLSVLVTLSCALLHQEGPPRPLPAEPPRGSHARGQRQQLAGHHQRRPLGLQCHPADLLGLHQGQIVKLFSVVVFSLSLSLSRRTLWYRRAWRPRGTGEYLGKCWSQSRRRMGNVFGWDSSLSMMPRPLFFLQSSWIGWRNEIASQFVKILSSVLLENKRQLSQRRLLFCLSFEARKP